MKKVLFLIALLGPCVLGACSQKCEVEPIVAENHKLIVPPNFGNIPK